MISKRVAGIAMVLATISCSGAMARNRTVDLATTQSQLSRWTVYEIIKQKVVSAPAVYNGTNTWGDIPSIAIPFTNCDGYWYTRMHFHIPVGATNLVFKITGLGVDDRAVIVLNHKRITSVGTQSNGKGSMQFHDPGHNKTYDFQFIAGTVSFTDTVDLKPGRNEIKVIVNNTGHGINGTIEPINPGSPSSFGIAAKVSYTE
jgi:hypothetical protein